MRVFLSILLLIFSVQAFAKADDIRDFEIEGMSIGQSLLDYVNVETINNSRKYNYNDDKFYTLDLILDKFTTYYGVQVHLKKNDNNYKIYGIGGGIKFGEAGIYFPQSEKICKKQMNVVEKDLDQIFTNSRKDSAKSVGQGDYDPKAKRDDVYYTLENGHIYLQCTTWGKEAKKREHLFDNLRLTLLGLEFYNWFENEAY